jgi:hypothetical protein
MELVYDRCSKTSLAILCDFVKISLKEKTKHQKTLGNEKIHFKDALRILLMFICGGFSSREV